MRERVVYDIGCEEGGMLKAGRERAARVWVSFLLLLRPPVWLFL